MDITGVTETTATVIIGPWRKATCVCSLDEEPQAENLIITDTIGISTRGLTNAVKREAAKAIREKRSGT